MNNFLGFDSVPAETRAVFRLLARENARAGDALKNLILIGGTAIAMRENHRLSVDLDFATGDVSLDVCAIKKLIDAVSASGAGVVDITDPAVRDDFTDSGLDVEHYQQDWLINGVKVTFFSYGKNPIESATLRNAGYCIVDGIKVADMHTLSLTKCQVLANRTKSRDLFDVDMLIRKRHITMRNVIAEMQRANPHMTFEDVVYRIIEKPIQSNDEGLSVIGVTEDIRTIRERLANQVIEVGKEIAAAWRDSMPHPANLPPKKPKA